MKKSRYNYFINYGDETVVFNGITERFFRIKTANRQFYQELFENPDQYDKSVPGFIRKMVDDGFIVESSDEWPLIMQKIGRLRKSEEYFLMILPTYQCNLRCWYCIQKHQELWMFESIVKNVKKHISIAMENPELKTLHLSWFGGEPLMAYDKIIEITAYAQKEALSKGKIFNCQITTNATLLNEERIEELHRNGVNGYQITIDGRKELHDKVKHLPNESSYDKILRNINLITRHTGCCVRFNYTKDNLEPENLINDLCKRLPEENRGKIRFLIYKVWQEDGNQVDPGKLDTLFELSKKNGLHPKLARSGMCYADQSHFTCIYPNGNVGKCDNNNPLQSTGRLTEDGSVDWSGLPERFSFSGVISDNSECKGCEYFPVCSGPCYAKREAALKKDSMIHCMYDDRHSYMEEILRNIIRNFESIETLSL